jgi:hypothetical protein
MLKMAEEQGLNAYPKTLRCEVLGGMKGPLAEYQLEKAASFAKEFISEINKKIRWPTVTLKTHLCESSVSGLRHYPNNT